MNGKRNGKGKEYLFGNLIFEGEYVNGKRNGKGKKYDYNGKLKFEGEYYENQRILFVSNNQKDNLTKFNKKECQNSNESINGKIKVYDYLTDNLIFEGEYLNGKRNGKCKEYNDKGTLIFEGEYLNGKKWEGKMYYPLNNEVFEIKNGRGWNIEYDYSNSRKIFEGEYLNGERNGKGKEYDSYGELRFEGEYLNGKKNGKGKQYDYNGN